MGNNRIRMIGPDGSVAMIPEGMVKSAENFGARRLDAKNESHPIAALGKGFISGAIGSIPDIASSLYNIPASAINYAKQHPEMYEGAQFDPTGTFAPINPNQAELPMIPSATEAIGKSIENVIGETPENYKHLVEGSKLVGSLAGPGGMAKVAGKKGLELASKGLEYLGSLKPSVLTGGALSGTTMSKLNEEGYSPLTQVAAGLGMGSLPAVSKSLAKKGVEGSRKLSAKALGLSPKQLNLEAAKAAQESGIDLPASAFTESRLMGLADQYIGKTPYFGDKLRDKYLKGEKQTLDKLNSIYEDVGPVKTEEIENQIGKLYKDTVNNLPQNASISPNNTLNTIDSILERLKKSASPSDDQAYVIKKLTDIREDIIKKSTTPSNLSQEEIKWLKNNNFREEDIAKLGKTNNEYPVENLWETKKSLNDTINWNIKDNDYKDLLKKVQRSILEDIGEYGQKDPSWYNSFKSADELFGKVAKRQRLEYLLSEKPINQATGKYSYNSLSKIIHTPKTSREIKNLTSPETFEKIEKLGDVARTMSIKMANIPNPSGSAIVIGIGSLLGGLFTAPLPTVAAVVGLQGLTKMLTDKKFLDLAIKTAERTSTKPSKDLLQLRKKVKTLTGLSINTINNRMNGLMNSQKNEDENRSIRMIGPDGTVAMIPPLMVKSAQKMGARLF